MNVELTSEEIAARQAEAERAEVEYWEALPYDAAVNGKIRERYTASQEYADYYAYCEECKAFVKEKKGMARYPAASDGAAQ